MDDLQFDDDSRLTREGWWLDTRRGLDFSVDRRFRYFAMLTSASACALVGLLTWSPTTQPWAPSGLTGPALRWAHQPFPGMQPGLVLLATFGLVLLGHRCRWFQDCSAGQQVLLWMVMIGMSILCTPQLILLATVVGEVGIGLAILALLLRFAYLLLS